MSDPSQANQLERLRQFVPLFSLSDERLRELLALSSFEVVPPGVHLFQEGDVDNQTVYLCRGEVLLRAVDGGAEESVVAETPQARHPVGDSQPRRASAVAVTELEILRIDNNVLDYMITWDQLGGLAASEAGRASDAAARWMSTAEQVLPFRSVPGANMRALSQRMERVAVKAGETVVRQGEPGDYYYLIEEGAARVTRQVELAELGAGASFGEEALLSEAERNASVTMTADGVLLRLSKHDFDELLREPLLNWVSAADARSRVNAGARWLDVRHGREYSHYRLPNALNLPLHELRQRMDELEQGVQYICYCKTGRRSSAAAFLLSQAGYDVAVLRGGLQVLPPIMRGGD